MANTAIRTLFSGVALCSLVACTGFQFPGVGGNGKAPAGAVELVQRDVEAPEVLDITEPGLWDGRQSNGGVWVSHPTLTAPERVIVRNPNNNSFVIGAMFRKDAPSGPGLRVSSDAAQALGLTPGAVTPLSVTALRSAQDVFQDAANAEPAAQPAAPTLSNPTVEPIAPAVSEEPTSVATTAAVATAAAASPLKFPFVQIGIFSTRANADKAAGQISRAGLVPVVTRLDLNGKTFWKVAIGPLGSAAAQDAALATAKRLGYPDAFPAKS